jgi:tRNA G18 (ribose-2'-O)-methylase SpoU
MPASTSKQLYIIAHNIRSLHNVGSIFRAADALGVSKIYLTGYTGAPPDPKIAKVALGAENFVPWEKSNSAALLIKKLRAQQPQLRIAALENNLQRRTVALNKFKPQFPLALIIGEETKGINKSLLDLADDIVEIPMRGQKESLNVSVALGIAAYSLLYR